MKKRLKNSIISIVLALMMVVTYTPLAGITGIENSTAYAKTNQCRIGSTYYDSLSAAFNSASNGQTIVMMEDATGERIVLHNGRRVTLDLNGYTFTRNCTKKTRDVNNYNSVRDEKRWSPLMLH